MQKKDALSSLLYAPTIAHKPVASAEFHVFIIT